MGTKVKTKKKATASKTKHKFEEYYDDIDLRTWWEEFSTDANLNGTLVYKTVWQFISAKAKEKWKRDFLWWILGPASPSDKSELFGKYDRFDWTKRRDNGKWYNEDSSQHLVKELKSKQTALAAMKEVGQVNVKFISRLENFMKEIDDEYSGRLFLPGLSSKANARRTGQYVQLLQQAQAMLVTATQLYGKTHGIDIERLDMFFAMLAKGTNPLADQLPQQMGFIDAKLIESGNEDSEQKKTSSTEVLVARMMLDKAAERELALPTEEIGDAILESRRPKLVKGN